MKTFLTPDTRPESGSTRLVRGDEFWVFAWGFPFAVVTFGVGGVMMRSTEVPADSARITYNGLLVVGYEVKERDGVQE